MMQSAVEDAPNEADGVVTRTGDNYELVFVRRLNRPVEKVWAALTLPERLVDWLGEVTFEDGLKVGARFDLHIPANGYRTRCQVVAFDPRRLFAWTWGLPDGPARFDEAIRFELVPTPSGCTLTLTNPGVPRDHLESVAAGWHTHLAALEGATDFVSNPWTVAREQAHLQRYTAAFATI